jgi:hypothetical protein
MVGRNAEKHCEAFLLRLSSKKNRDAPSGLGWPSVEDVEETPE